MEVIYAAALARGYSVEELEAIRIKKVENRGSFEVLEQKIGKLNDPNLSLEESFENYKEGMDLVKKCHAMIDQVEKEDILFVIF